MKLKEYSIEQLIHNSSFRRMMRGTASVKEIEKWNDWIESNGENREKARKAIGAISGFSLKNSTAINIDSEWNRLQSSIQKNENATGSRYSTAKISTKKWIYRVAVVLILASMIGAGVHYYSVSQPPSGKLEQITEFKTVETGSQERKTLTFTSGSKIEINSNTRLSYETGSKHGGTINVVLDGEAFFESGDNGSTDVPSFSVKTPDGIITDIGTAFLVHADDNQSEVVLEEGRVHVRQISIRDTANVLEMKKGEIMSFRGLKILDRKTVNTTFYTSWATGFLKFDDTSLTSLAHYVEERFDVRVQIVNPALTDIKLDGGIYFNSLAELVRSVSKVLEFSVYQSHDKQTVYFGNK